MRVLAGTLRATAEAVVVKVPLLPPGPEKARLVREARLVDQVEHPSLARLRGVYFHPEGELALVYDRVEGPTLRQALEAGRLPQGVAVRVLEEVASGLDALHDAGLVCRDVKPANVVLPEVGPSVIVDFGLIRGGDQPTLTAQGMVLGTPVYLAPEGFRGHRLEKAADIYALGVMAYEMLVGRPPFVGDVQALARQHLSAAVPSLAETPDLPGPALDPVFARALAKDPTARPDRAGTLVAELLAGLQQEVEPEAASRTATRRLLASEPAAPRRVGGRTTRKRGRGRRWVVGGVVLAGGLAVLLGRGIVGESEPPPSGPPVAAGDSPPAAGPDPRLPPLDPEELRDELARLTLDQDPLRWAEQVGRVEGVERFRAWLARRPPQEVSPPEARERARVAGEAFRVLGLASPFEPYLEVEPLSGPVTPGELFPGGRGDLVTWAQRHPAPQQGLLGAGMLALREARERFHQHRRALRKQPTGPFPGGVVIPHANLLWELGTKITVVSFVSQASQEEDGRRRLRGWMAPAERDLHRALVALGRSFEHEPERAGVAAVLAVRALSDLLPYFFGRLHGCPVGVLLGRPEDPSSPAQLFVAAAIEEHAARIEKEIAVTDPERFLRETELRLAILRHERERRGAGWPAVLGDCRSRLKTLSRRARGTAAAAPVRALLEGALPDATPESRVAIERALEAAER